jgi:hypothetical protein
MLVGHFGLLFGRVAMVLPARPAVITGLDPVTSRGTVAEPARGSSPDRWIIARP